LEGGKGGSWDVQSAVALDRIYFLTRDAHDRAEPLGAGHALVMLAESAQQIAQVMERAPRVSDADKRALRLERFELLCALAKTIPAHRLYLSLTGAFWEHLG
jgi:hypothetical protein